MSAVLCKTALHSTTWIPIDFYLVAFSSVFSTKLCLASISINKLSGYVSHSPLSSWLINTYYLLQTWSFRFQTIFFSFETLFIVLHFSPSYRKKITDKNCHWAQINKNTLYDKSKDLLSYRRFFSTTNLFFLFSSDARHLRLLGPCFFVFPELSPFSVLVALFLWPSDVPRDLFFCHSYSYFSQY